ncbi:hypothetical protein [Rhizobium leguminosarum]|uniref:Uncharacterized protein n=1 Tax=Rhizobium leguminosarum TaxID=384 RepID=A0A179BBW5_RHILE|nr:hypothetical protein [Rhizobium leguminosarum]MBY5440860.1 hypothetical protein [Rhizobium leguminosarum]OAP88849.1 hypothetical protein A4U53_34350 [Rhizobium leguminosarum]
MGAVTDGEENILATDPKISGRSNIGSLVIPGGSYGNGVKPIAREVHAVEYVSDDFRNFFCGSAPGAFFLHTASDKLFQI